MAVLKIYNDIQTEKEKAVCRFWGDAEGVCFKDVDEFVSSIKEDDNTIEIRLYCDGGSVLEGWAMYDKLRATGKEITTIVEGNSASMATVLMMAAPKERRKCYANAEILVHNPWMDTYCMGPSTADDLKKAEESLRQEQEKILNLYVERCGCDKEEMQNLMNENTYINAEKAKSFGLVGEIIQPISAKKITTTNFMAKEKEEKKVEVKQSLLDKVLAKFGKKDLSELVKGMDLSTSDGKTLTVERESGEPQVGDAASPDGEFIMPDGKTIVVENGVITDIKTDGDGNGDGNGDGDNALEQRISELEDEVDDLKKKLTECEAKAKTTDDLRILNAVKIAGGEKALAKISSTFKPEARKSEGKKTGEVIEDKSPIRLEIEARKNGTWGKK